MKNEEIYQKILDTHSRLHNLTGVSISDLCKEHKVLRKSFYNWRKKKIEEYTKQQKESK